MDSYDAIIYGNDIHSLITALLILKKEKRVLLVNQNDRVGNFTEYYQRRRFTFNNIYNTLSFASEDNNDMINRLIKELNTNTNFLSDDKLHHIISINRDSNIKKEYLLPMGIDKFIEKVDEYIPGSKDSVTDFFSLAEECHSAIEYIIQNKINEKEMKALFPNFVKIVNKSVSEVLDSIKMPIATQEIINACWLYFGTPETELSFVDYAAFMYNLVKNNIKVPEEGYESFIAKIFQEYIKLGGNYINGVHLNKIIILEHEVTGIILNNEIYYTSNFITSLNPHLIYNRLIEKNEIPREALQLCNKRIFDGTPFTIYLGLNRTADELGLNCSKYFIYNNLDSDVEYNKMSSISNNTSIVTVNSLINPNIAPKGTSIVTIESYFFNNSFENYATYDKYNEIVDDITNNLITVFEEKTGIRIRDYIEEIIISTPVDYYNQYEDTNYFGYKLKPLDNTIMRIANYPNEEYIKGLYFTGHYGVLGGTFNNMLLTNKFIAEKVTKR